MFTCQRCGHCCTELKDGTTVLPEDVEKIAYHLRVPKKRVKDRYTYTKDGMRFLNQPCPFYEDGKGCRVYVARPRVCHLYPLQAKDGRYGAATGCPGAKIVPIGVGYA